MTMELLQDGAVTVIAIAAAAVLLRRVIAFTWPSTPHSACSSCPSRQRTCAAKGQALPASVAPVPLRTGVRFESKNTHGPAQHDTRDDRSASSSSFERAP